MPKSSAKAKPAADNPTRVAAKAAADSLARPVPERDAPHRTSRSAAALGKLGGAKGGDPGARRETKSSPTTRVQKASEAVNRRRESRRNAAIARGDA